MASRCQWGTCLTRDNGRAVRTDGERQNSPHVLVVPRSLFAHVSKTVPTFAIFRVPYFCCPVHTGRHDKLAVGGETTARHWSGMPTEHLHAVTLCVKNCSTKKNEQKMNKRRTKEEQKKNNRQGAPPVLRCYMLHVQGLTLDPTDQQPLDLLPNVRRVLFLGHRRHRWAVAVAG